MRQGRRGGQDHGDLPNYYKLDLARLHAMLNYPIKQHTQSITEMSKGAESVSGAEGVMQS